MRYLESSIPFPTWICTPYEGTDPAQRLITASTGSTTVDYLDPDVSEMDDVDHDLSKIDNLNHDP